MRLEHDSGIFYTKTLYGIAEVHYRIKDNVMEIYNTSVPEEDKGHGIAEKLTKAAFDFARGNGYRVDPQCSYTQAFVEQHEKYKIYTKISSENPSSENQPMHPIIVAGYPASLEDLAKNVTKMRYDAVTEFFGYLAKEITRQAEADQKRGREQLAVKLGNIAHLINEAEKEMATAWKICKPHMEKKH